MSVSPQISIIVPHYHDLPALDRCLAALERQTLGRDGFEIIVADNNSPEGEAAVRAAIGGRARLVVVTERGAGPARNGGVKIAVGSIFAFTDSDCVPEPGWLMAGIAGLSAYDFVGGHVRVLLQNPPKMSAVEAFERVFAFDFKTYIQKKGFTGSGNMFCPRSVFEAVGGFRTGVSEDVEWSHRATSLGYRLGYAPDAIVGHPARQYWSDLISKWKRVNLETFGLSNATLGQRMNWLLRTLALPVSAIIHTPKVMVSQELDTLTQRLAALSVLYRLRFWRMGDALRLLWARGT